jgi:HD-GYP domain-containing protein (c-di-GMP phosphodiesterase class II)
VSPAERCLHVFGHALAAHGLYGPGHQARKEASGKLEAAVTYLLAVDQHPSFTFLDDTVLYRAAPVHGLKDWSWSRRLGATGIRRVEFSLEMTRRSLEDFLDAVHRRLSGDGDGDAMPGFPGIDSGEVVVVTPPDPLIGQLEGLPAGPISLGDEVGAVRHAFDRVAQGGILPLEDLDAVIRALTVALRSEGELLIPLVALRALDDHAALHAVNTAVLTMTFCEWLGLAGGDIRAVGKAALLHDIGMARVPKDVFRIQAMSPSGRQEVARHPESGARLLLARSSKLDLAATTAYEHHLRIDGQGYPVRRFHKDLHYISRIIAVCGAYDALRSERSYRPAHDPLSALTQIEAGAGTVYDPGIAYAFMQMMQRWEHRLVVARSD